MLNSFKSGVIDGWSFKPSDLDLPNRKIGVSAFMRIRNGAAFLEPTIRSHIGLFDEIVAVYNQCTDDTASILMRLRQEFGEKLRVFHYLGRVFPQGSDGHIKTAGASPSSIVNYSNCALALTQYRVVTKLDDDHLAVTQAVRSLVDELRVGHHSNRHMLCFSGLNLVRSPAGSLAVPAVEPVSGGGDIGFFYVSEDTRFFYDPRFERFSVGEMNRRFVGYLYWHLKYLKPGAGFNNYELDANPTSRFARKRAAYFGNQQYLERIDDVCGLLKPSLSLWTASLLSKKKRLAYVRNTALLNSFPQEKVELAVQETTDPYCFRLAFGEQPPS